MLSCINNDFETLRFTTGDRVTIQYQLRDANNNPIDITDQAFKFAAKKTNDAVDYEIGPVDADIDDVALGLFSFTFTVGAEAFDGVYEIVQIDGALNQFTLTPAGGVLVQVLVGLIN